MPTGILCRILYSMLVGFFFVGHNDNTAPSHRQHLGHNQGTAVTYAEQFQLCEGTRPVKGDFVHQIHDAAHRSLAILQGKYLVSDCRSDGGVPDVERFRLLDIKKSSFCLL